MKLKNKVSNVSNVSKVSGVLSKTKYTDIQSNRFINHFTHSTHNTHNTHLKRTGFTLAEVLITLGIIGVVAAITMPVLIAKYQEKETVTKLKNFYSIISQAYKLASINYGSADEWGIQTTWDDSTKDTTWKFLPYLKKVKICEPQSNCLPDKVYLSTDDNNYADYNDRFYSAILPNGMVFYALMYNSTCSKNVGAGSLKNVCGEIAVDINGKKLPNTWGKDFFLFYITKNEIIPAGMSVEVSNYTFDRFCSTRELFGCTAWVIYNENMDYLKCPGELSWNSKTKCD